MWRCPSCGKQIDDEFDACWRCGTSQDGTPNADFHAEPDDPAPPPESKTPEDADTARLRRERIVELCSAGDMAEAEGFCELLGEAGIQARVVGDFLGNTATGLPLGETTSPRIWVFASDAARAQEILELHFRELENEPEETPEDSAGEEEPAEPEEGELPSAARFRPLGLFFYFFALACVAIGSIWALWNGTTLFTYSATTGKAILGGMELMYYTPASNVARFPLEIAHTNLPQISYASRYVYVVDGHVYFTGEFHAEDVPSYAPIYYNPRQPAECVVGPITSPWMILLFALGVGAFLTFVGYQFR